MDEFNRRVPLNQRGNIDGITPRRPVAGTPDNSNAQSPSPAAPKPANDDQAPAQKPTDQQPVKKNLPKKPKKKRNLIAVTLAIIVFIGLSVFAVYAGLQKNTDKDEGNQAAQTSSTRNTDTVDTDIERLLGEIDDLDDGSDKSGENLSDAKLGL